MSRGGESYYVYQQDGSTACKVLIVPALGSWLELTNNKEDEMNAIKQCEIVNEVDANGNPSGGGVIGTGLEIKWQDGPLGRDENRREPNGAFVETVISAAKQRLEYFQEASNKKFSCRENAVAITKLDEALMWLEKRTKDREERAVEGTHKV